MNRVETAIKSREGQSYIEVTSKNDAGEVVYAHAALVDNDPRLHEVLLQHAWCLNQRTGHLVTHSPTGLFAEALAAQGDIPSTIPLPRCLAAAVANGRKIDRVLSRPTDYRYEALTIEWERAVAVFTPELAGEAPRTLMTSAVQSHAVSVERRAQAAMAKQEIRERRNQAEQRATARHFERLNAKAAKAEKQKLKVTQKLTGEVCKAMADDMLAQAEAAGAEWAINARRALAGQPSVNSAQAPDIYRRLRLGLPLLVEQPEAAVEHAQRYKTSQAHFEEFAALFDHSMSRAALRRVWVKHHPEHDWCAWVDETAIPAVSVDAQLKLAAPAPAALLPAPLTEEELRKRFEVDWDNGATTTGLPPEETRRFNALFDGAETREQRERLRVEYDAAVKSHAWAGYKETHK